MAFPTTEQELNDFIDAHLASGLVLMPMGWNVSGAIGADSGQLYFGPNTVMTFDTGGNQVVRIEANDGVIHCAGLQTDLP